MADVRRWSSGDGGSRSRDRGQIIIVSALVLAVVLVALALVLNSVIYAENLATRDHGSATGEVIEQQQVAVESLASTMNEVNEQNDENATYTELRDRLRATMGNWTVLVNRQISGSAAVENVAVVDTSPGAVIIQNNYSRNYTAGGSMAGQATWKLIGNVDDDDITQFVMNISRKSLYSATFDTTKTALADSAFHVYVKDANGDTWRIYIFEGAATDSIYVLVEEPGETFQGTTEGYDNFATEACSTLGDRVIVRVKDAIVSKTPCPPLEFFANEVEPPYQIWYNNTTQTDPVFGKQDRVKGKYRILVNRTNFDRTPYYAAVDDKSPYTLTAIGSARLTLTYRTTTTEYESTLQVIPSRFGAFDFGHKPVIESWDVNDNSGTLTGNGFDVEWTVSDEDGDLEEVRVVLTNQSGKLIDEESTSVFGESASGTITVQDPTLVDDDNIYGIQIFVIDGVNNSATKAETHEADGDDTGDPP